MKRYTKLLASLAFLSCLFALCFTISASAKEYTGKMDNNAISWTYDDQTKTLTLQGAGKSTLNSFDFDTDAYPIETIVINGIAHINCELSADTIVLGKDVEQFMDDNLLATWELDGVPYADKCYEVDQENSHFASYDGALYTKDLTELIHVPQLKTEIKLANTLKKIDAFAFLYTSLDKIVIPWGVTTIEDYGVEFLFHRTQEVADDYLYVILPDTLNFIGKSDRYTMCRFVYSENNAAVRLSNLYPELGNVGQDISKELIYEKFAKTSFYDFYGITPNSFKTFNGKTYYFDTDCKMVTGTKTIGNIDYTFDENGVLQSQTAATVKNGLIYQNGKAYYYENGVMLKSRWVYAEGNWYYLNDYGAGVVSCWRLKDGKYCYLDRYGRMKTKSWVLDYGNWYYVSTDGSRYESRWAEINGIWYWFGGSGKMAQSQWLKLGGKWYYFTDSGAMVANKWVKSGAYWYYLGSDGAMLTNTTTPDGYKVDAQGRWK